SAGERAARNNALQRLGEWCADQPDQLARDELYIVAATAEQAGILVGAADTWRVTVLVDMQENILVVAEVVTVGDRAGELLLREPLGGLAALDQVELRQRLGKARVDAEALHVAADHAVWQECGDVPPVRAPRVR